MKNGHTVDACKSPHASLNLPAPLTLCPAFPVKEALCGAADKTCRHILEQFSAFQSWAPAMWLQCGGRASPALCLTTPAFGTIQTRVDRLGQVQSEALNLKSTELQNGRPRGFQSPAVMNSPGQSGDEQCCSAALQLAAGAGRVTASAPALAAVPLAASSRWLHPRNSSACGQVVGTLHQWKISPGGPDRLGAKRTSRHWKWNLDLGEIHAGKGNTC